MSEEKRERTEEIRHWDFQSQSFMKPTQRTRFYEQFGAFLCGFVLLSVPAILSTGYTDIFRITQKRYLGYAVLAFLLLISTRLFSVVKESWICPIGTDRFMLLLSLPLTAFGLFLMSMMHTNGSVLWMIFIDTLFLVIACPLYLSANTHKRVFYTGFVLGLIVLLRKPIYHDRRGWTLFMCMGAFLMNLGILMQFLCSIPERTKNDHWIWKKQKVRAHSWGLLWIQSLIPMLADILIRAIRWWT